MKINCIVIEDEPLALKKVSGYINRIDYLYLLFAFNNAIDAIGFLKTTTVDLIFLDIRMKKLTGIQFLESLKSKPKIIITSAYDEYALKGYELDVSDYLLKPFSFQELFVRIKALNRRNKELNVSPLLKVADLEMNTVSKKVTRSCTEIKLTSREYKILELLLSNQGKVFDRMEITEKVWGVSFNPGTNVIDVHINSLRNKIDKNFTPKLIHTKIGMGYVLTEE